MALLTLLLDQSPICWTTRAQRTQIILHVGADREPRQLVAVNVCFQRVGNCREFREHAESNFKDIEITKYCAEIYRLHFNISSRISNANV